MSVDTQTAAPQKVRKNEWAMALVRSLRYLTIRSLVIFLTVVVGIYAAIWVTNLGGAGDEARKADIRAQVGLGARSAAFRDMSYEERQELLNSMYETAYVSADLDKPFLIRSFRYLRDAFTFSLGESRLSSTRRGSRVVLDILLEKLPMTLVLFGIANLLTFFGGLYIALILSRRYGSVLDRATTLLIPLFAAPPWFHGIFLIVIFAIIAKVLPFGGVIGLPYPETTSAYVLDFLKHMILPLTAFVLGMLPLAVYANRALFLIHSTEDYVELGYAMGLKPSRLRRRYILRPILPTVITSFAFISIASWQAVILTEDIFSWPGIGSLLITSIRGTDISVITGAVAMFAYLLGFSVLFLDVLYVLVDPRVRISGGRTT